MYSKYYCNNTRTTTALLLFLLCITGPISNVVGKNVLQTIRDIPDLSNFAIALSKGGLDTLLSDTTKQFTVFAPTNVALLSDEIFRTYIDTDGWVPHLKANVESMIIEGSVLTEAQIFDQLTTDLTSIGGPLKVSQTFSTVQLVSMARSDVTGTFFALEFLKRRENKKEIFYEQMNRYQFN